MSFASQLSFAKFNRHVLVAPTNYQCIGSIVKVLVDFLSELLQFVRVFCVNHTL
jgi:hypothetical protein